MSKKKSRTGRRCGWILCNGWYLWIGQNVCLQFGRNSGKQTRTANSKYTTFKRHWHRQYWCKIFDILWKNANGLYLWKVENHHWYCIGEDGNISQGVDILRRGVKTWHCTGEKSVVFKSGHLHFKKREQLEMNLRAFEEKGKQTWNVSGIDIALEKSLVVFKSGHLYLNNISVDILRREGKNLKYISGRWHCYGRQTLVWPPQQTHWARSTPSPSPSLSSPSHWVRWPLR